jgi:hypothetical protein
MIINKNYPILELVAVLIVVLTFGSSMSASTTTIEGEVNNFFQVVTEDIDVYDIAEDEKGKELAQNVGSRVRVTGMVQVDKGILDTRTIIVSSFEILQVASESEEDAEESNESVEENDEPYESVEGVVESDESVEENEESDKSMGENEESEEQAEEADDEQEN